MAMHRSALALIFAPVLVGADEHKWVYGKSGDKEASGTAQTETWSDFCNIGHEQSPINIVSETVVKTMQPSISTHFDTKVTYTKNTGHGWQIFETSPDAHSYNATSHEAEDLGKSKGHSMIGGNKFNFYQVHWHTPSENTVDGKHAAMEVHFVHQLADAKVGGSLHRLAVIGMLYDLDPDDKCNEFLDKFWGFFPTDKKLKQFLGEEPDFNAKLEEELEHGYYHWYGSLTTPPCTEGVSWNLLKKRETVCERQVKKLEEALEATLDGISFNNRVPQPLNHRVVVETAMDGTHAPTNTNLPADPHSAGHHWVYAEQGDVEANSSAQQETWAKGHELCVTGHEQSPIDIRTNQVTGDSTASITTHFDAKATYVKNSGHGFQVFETAPNNSGYNVSTGTVMSEDSQKGHSMIGGNKFNFYQLHWHTPSENTVNGEHAAMEVHFVHQLDDPALVGTTHRLAVIALLYDLGTDSECNAFLDKFWGRFPENKGNAAFNGDDLDLNLKLTEELQHGYYHWYGSLTTPPCTEGVSWNLLKKREKVCKRQVDKLKDALAATMDGISFNNRVTHPLNHRSVIETSAWAVVPTTGSATRLSAIGSFLAFVLACALSF